MINLFHKKVEILSAKAILTIACSAISANTLALDLSYNPEKDVSVKSDNSYVATALTVYKKESDENDKILLPSSLDENTPHTSSLSAHQLESTPKDTSIRLDFSEEKEKGWNIIPEIAFGEPEVFKDCREAVQWADSNNQPKTEPASLDRTLEKLGITHYQINLEAEYIF